MPETVFTIREVAEAGGFHDTTVRRWCQNGALTEGVDFFTLPHTEDAGRLHYRITQAGWNKIFNTPAFTESEE